MKTQLFSYANIIIGVLIFIVGFIFHWLGQLISIINWEFAKKIGLQEKEILPEYVVYEKGIAVADVLIGWIYGVVAVGLFLNCDWAYKLAWIPAVVLIYHALSFWFWTGNQNKAGQSTTSNTTRVVWFLINFITGVLTIIVIW